MGKYATFGGKGMLKFPEFLFVNTAICANFFWRTSGTEIIFLSILWSNLTIPRWNFRFVLSTCTCFLSFFLLLINCLILLSYICFEFLILHFEKQSFNIEFSLSVHLSQLVSKPLMSFQQSLR